jgi:hypothetical protein
MNKCRKCNNLCHKNRLITEDAYNSRGERLGTTVICEKCCCAICKPWPGPGV